MADWNWLENPQSWIVGGTLIGALLTKSIDYLLGRQRYRLDAGNSTLGHVNAATKLLIDGLISQIGILQKEMEATRKELDDLRRLIDEKDEHIVHLETEMNRLRDAMRQP